MRGGKPWAVRRERWRSKYGDRWHDFFAWHPVTVKDGTWVWLEAVERRYMYGMTNRLPDYRLKRTPSLQGGAGDPAPLS